MQIDNEVLNALSNAHTEGAILKLVGQLDRPLYTRTNKVLEAAGGKWNRKAGGHVFEGDAADAMDQIILTGEIPSLKTRAQLFMYFPTPANVAQMVIDLADIQPGMSVLEPSAGRGSLAYPAADKGAKVECIELMTENFESLSHPNITKKFQCDFLSLTPCLVLFDRIVMNPPFNKQDDIKHVQHAVKFLKPTGRLVSVMSSGVTFRDNKLTTEFRAMVSERGGEIIPLESGSFAESGTMVNTVIVVIPGVA